ncbi:hypothetical protein [Paenibacillus sp. MBLB4367]|uniref:hypothetical protein n=1 Tax=Paenibacillus sp. MBLB4367 TaxID=3384767 RepID=UPI0039080E83
MMKIALGLLLLVYVLLMAPLVPVHAEVVIPPPVVNEETVQPEEGTFESQAARSGRGSYRSPVGGYTGGNRSGINPATGTDRSTRGDTARQSPASGGGRFGSFFGGLAAGTLLGSILNPFGFGGYGAGFGGFSLIGILFWAVILFVIYRLVRKWIRTSNGNRY